MGQKLSSIPEQMTERQKAMALAQRELMMAMQTAKLRDDFRWMCAFHCTMGTLLLLGAVKTHNPRLLVPLVPMGFSLSYVYDAAFGSKMERILHGAEEVLASERQRFIVPRGNRMVEPEEYANILLAPPLLTGTKSQ